MDKLLSQFKITTCVCCILLVFNMIVSQSNAMAVTESSVRADPDLVYSGFGYAQASVIKVGDLLKKKYFQLSGFIEVRNEPIFNCELLPNHTWRGYMHLYGLLPFHLWNDHTCELACGYEHESAHPTMGIKKETMNAFEKIYDDNYRITNLNSVVLRYFQSCSTKTACIKLVLDYQWYFKSRNTPELAGNRLGSSHGASAGVEGTIALSKNRFLFCSLFDRYIHTGSQKITGIIYSGNDATFSSALTLYPLMNAVNSASAAIGVSTYIAALNRSCDVYVSYIFGNIFGFVDSREKRKRLTVGINLLR
ncbi:MAG: hypothetical protein JW795_17705 [Chitinivibrionales bacterium]|nr:hypothetical protein [Chitinivibrionales bacterium]